MTDVSFWPTACHEAGHGVVAWALGGELFALNLCEDGAGLARTGHLTAFDNATVTAAGPIAEQLADTAPPPVVSDTAPPPVLRTMPDATLTAFARSAGLPPKETTSDARATALWAICGREHDPECWRHRAYLVERRAKQMVAQHHDKIVAVARELMFRGELLRTDLEALLPPLVCSPESV